LFSHFYNILTSVIKGIVNLPGNCFHISPAGIYSNWITIQGNLFARVETHRHTCRKIYMHVWSVLENCLSKCFWQACCTCCTVAAT